MAEEFGLKDTSSTQINCDSSDSSFEIKIKTLDLQTYSFRVNKNMSISTLKEEIVTKICVPIERLRLLYKGKVLNNAQLLSELNLEEGDTMYLVERQPVQSQPTSSTVVADTSRTSSSQGAGAESSQNTRRIQSDNPANGGHISISNVPLDRIPFLPILIPDALTTISELMDGTEMALQSCINLLNAGPHQVFSTNTIAEYLNTRRGIPNPEFLSFILDRTDQFLRESVATALSNLSTRLQRIHSPSNPVLRGRIQLGVIQLVVAMHELGAMFLELGRVIMCQHIDQTAEESFINAEPAIFLSPIGPNPTAIQLVPYQSSYPYETNNPAYFRREQPLFPSRSSYPSETNNPAYFRIEQPVPTHLASRGFRPTASTGYQCHETTLQSPSLLGSDSFPTLGAQFTASIPYVLSSNAQVQSSSNAMQSGATQDFHAVVSSETQSDMSDTISETQSDMSDTILQPPELPNFIMHETQMNVNELSDLEDLFLDSSNDGFSQEDILLDIGNDGVSYDSEIVIGAEDGNQSSSGENHDSDLAVSGKVEQQFDLGLAVDRIEQNDDSRSIFEELLESSVPLYEEQNVYQDMFEPGNTEELADEFMEVLRLDIHRRLAK